MAIGSLKLENARFILTVDDERRIITDGAIVVEDGAITGVGKSVDFAGRSVDRTLDATDMVVTPGFTTATCTSATRMRCVESSRTTSKTGSRMSFQMQLAMTAEEERDTSMLAAVELLKGGDDEHRRSRQHEVHRSLPGRLRTIGN